MKMKKTSMIIASAILSASLASGAIAAPDQEKETNPKAKGQAQAEVSVEKGKPESKKSDADQTGQPSVTSVTYSTYGGHNGYIGLQNAYEHVKDKPAGKVIAGLLENKYGIDVQAAVSQLDGAAGELEAEGDLEAAAEVQKAAVKLDVTNLNSYKKLGKILEKAGRKGVKAYVNGEEPKFEVPPFIKNGSTLVPFRAISEALKAEVTWNQEEQSVTVVKGDITVKLFIGSTTAYVNGEEVELEVPGEIHEGNTMVPARFISEALKAKVLWEQETLSVVIYEENNNE